MTFRIGQKVVCIKSGLQNVTGHEPSSVYVMPNRGDVYTVRECFWHLRGKTQAVRLIEISNAATLSRFGEASFAASCFRPLVRTSTRQSRQAIIDRLKEKELVS